MEDNEPEERLLNRFRREVMRAGVIQECKRRRYHENKQEEKKRKTREAHKRNRRRSVLLLFFTNLILLFFIVSFVWLMRKFEKEGFGWKDLFNLRGLVVHGSHCRVTFSFLCLFS